VPFGVVNDALYDYQALANYCPGAEARVRHGLLLDKAGRPDEANAVFIEVLTRLKRAPKYVRRVEAIALAKKGTARLTIIEPNRRQIRRLGNAQRNGDKSSVEFHWHHDRHYQ
jgi:hypothetical protein